MKPRDVGEAKKKIGIGKITAERNVAFWLGTKKNRDAIKEKKYQHFISGGITQMRHPLPGQRKLGEQQENGVEEAAGADSWP